MKSAEDWATNYWGGNEHDCIKALVKEVQQDMIVSAIKEVDDLIPVIGEEGLHYNGEDSLAECIKVISKLSEKL